MEKRETNAVETNSKVGDSKMATYTEIVEGIKTKFASFAADADSGADNRGAALRARKLSMELRKDMQEFRKASVTNDHANSKPRAPKAAKPAAEATPAA